MLFGLFLNGFGLCAGAELKFTVVHDPEALRKDNPVENKYLKLMRYNRGLLDKDLKPDQKERNQLKVRVGLADYWLVSIQVLTDVLRPFSFSIANSQLPYDEATHGRGEGVLVEVPLLPQEQRSGTL